MRLIYLIIGLLCTSLALCQSKQTTIEWINSKAPNNPIVYGDFFKASSKMKINNDGTFQVTISDYESPIDPFNPRVELETVIKGNLKDFNPQSVSSRQKGKLLFIELKCRNNKDCLSIYRSGEAGIYYDKDGVSFGAYDNSEYNIAERLKKAFRQLIIYCGGVEEAY
jgi:hypothetical protein